MGSDYKKIVGICAGGHQSSEKCRKWKKLVDIDKDLSKS